MPGSLCGYDPGMATRGHVDFAGETPIRLTLTWDGPPRISVERNDGHVSVTAHVELSEANVMAACLDLDPNLGETVLNAWRNSMTLPRSPGSDPSAN